MKYQAGMKMTGRNINNLRYEENTTLTAESEEELKSLLLRVKEENEKAGLSLRSRHLVPPLHGKGERVEATTDFLFLRSKIYGRLTAVIKFEDDCFLEGKL